MRLRRDGRRGGRMALLAVLAAAALATPSSAVPPTSSQAGHSSLTALFDELLETRSAAGRRGVPDYSPPALAERRDRLDALRGRFDQVDTTGWAPAERIDYLLVRAQLDAADFELRVTRPWERDPGWAVDAIRRTAYASVPEEAADREALGRRLRAVAAIVEHARESLSAASAELAGMAIRQLANSDGINQGEPRRDTPPEGLIGWFRDLEARVAAEAPGLLPDVRAALDATVAYHDWLVEQRPEMTAPAWVGLAEYDWYLRHVLLMPYDHVDLRRLAARELQRARTFLMIEEHRNRDLPPIEPVSSAEEHELRVRGAETLIRDFMQGQGLVTIPDGLPAQFETDAFWIVRPGGKRHFWEEITYRDPLNNHLHASIPGHRFDGLVQRLEQRPVRGRYRDGVRSEGWAFYIEEMFLQAGLLDDRPRAKELFYIAQLKRAARVHAELEMQTGAFDLGAAIDYLVEQVPLMEEDLARYDLQIYLRRPTYGMNYVMGKIQLEALLSDRALQLGDEFDLGSFHDEFLRSGPIPISLIRWEMTGLDNEIAELW